VRADQRGGNNDDQGKEAGTGIGGGGRDTMSGADFRWGRVIVGGLAAEIVVFAIVFPVRTAFGQKAFLASILISTTVMPLLAALWVCKKAVSQFVLHGALVGAVSVLLYLAIARGQPEPLLYKISHVLKIVGGAAGGLVAARRRIS
jgi:hypothetical protein